MGFFSWNTTDTDRSIANQYSGKDVFLVIMKDDKGNKYFETEYEGYGVFGGKDYYELLAEMNEDIHHLYTKNPDNPYDSGDKRDIGIDLYFAAQKNSKMKLKYPALYEIDQEWRNKKTKDCEFQGYFYDDCMDIFF